MLRFVPEVEGKEPNHELKFASKNFPEEEFKPFMDICYLEGMYSFTIGLWFYELSKTNTGGGDNLKLQYKFITNNVVGLETHC